MQEKMFISSEADIASRCRGISRPGLYTILPEAQRVLSVLPLFNSGVKARVLAAPAMGARFVEYELFVEPNGSTQYPVLQDLEHFFYVLEGGLELALEGKKNRLVKGSFCWLPPNLAFEIQNKGQETCRLLWIRRRFEVVAGFEIPAAIFAHEEDVPAEPTDTYMEKHLTPYEDPLFDLGINLQIFDPGVYFTFVESHVMEHGLYMLAGRGIYWLNKDFIEVQKDDFIYMAPFCPQFYYATGWERSAYLLYKNVNRDYTAGL